jgi:hypothetical protein
MRTVGAERVACLADDFEDFKAAVSKVYPSPPMMRSSGCFLVDEGDAVAGATDG